MGVKSVSRVLAGLRFPAVLALTVFICFQQFFKFWMEMFYVELEAEKVPSRV